ncbi:hypothetical protein [Jannaschia sp. LMIT008]|uniref:hypothetical protein n=1 Tax=Jannaschia maritima TaxID=3032585 RepID=UPI0028116AAC|nr:hypothetical protein [Jannaschia sp. LMIT008]
MNGRFPSSWSNVFTNVGIGALAIAYYHAFYSIYGSYEHAGIFRSVSDRMAGSFREIVLQVELIDRRVGDDLGNEGFKASRLLFFTLLGIFISFILGEVLIRGTIMIREFGARFARRLTSEEIRGSWKARVFGNDTPMISSLIRSGDQSSLYAFHQFQMVYQLLYGVGGLCIIILFGELFANIRILGPVSGFLLTTGSWEYLAFGLITIVLAERERYQMRSAFPLKERTNMEEGL